MNKSSRKLVCCPYCDEKLCLQCAMSYIGSKLQDPHCMFCKVEWSKGFVRDTFPKSWLAKDYKKLKEQLLFDTELAKMPETQIYCDAWKYRVDLLKEKETVAKALQEKKSLQDLFKTDYETCMQDIWMLQGTASKEELSVLLNKSHELKEQLDNVLEEYETLKDQMDTIVRNISEQTALIEGNPTTKKHSFMFTCPSNRCKGFIGDDWRCGVCKSLVCDKCREICKDDHQCDETIVATIETLTKEAKPCPKCGSMISKISGCDQMWCTICHQAFSWTTGAFEDQVHNPHYYEWLTRTEGRIDDEIVRCPDEFLTDRNMYAVVRKIRESFNQLQERERITNMVRLVKHVQEVELAKYMRSSGKDPNRSYRIQYMIGEIDEETFRKILERTERERVKKREIGQVLDMWSRASEDALNNWFQDKLSSTDLQKWSEEFRVYTNDVLGKVAKENGCKAKFIPNEYDEVSTLTVEKASYE